MWRFKQRSPSWLVVTIAILFVLLLNFFIIGVNQFRYFIHRPIIPIQQSLAFTLKPGHNISALANTLHKKSWLNHPRLLNFYVRLRGLDTQLQAGEYFFQGGISPRKMINKIIAGDVVKHHFTIVEGWNAQQLLTALRANPDLKHVLNKLTIKQISQKLKLKQANPEGFFYPDTYQFIKGFSDEELLKLAYNKQQKLLQQFWQSRSKYSHYKNPYQALVAASLIEKETAKQQERSIIAGIILNRLKKGMRLQIDPTVIYGLGDRYKGKLTRRLLKIRTPYNTYVHRGLPPTPIAIPSVDSLQAALHPKITPYLYFVAKGDGSHVFSTTLVQQQHAIKKYLSPKHSSKKLKHKKLQALTKKRQVRYIT